MAEIEPGANRAQNRAQTGAPKGPKRCLGRQTAVQQVCSRLITPWITPLRGMGIGMGNSPCPQLARCSAVQRAISARPSCVGFVMGCFGSLLHAVLAHYLAQGTLVRRAPLPPSRPRYLRRSRLGTRHAQLSGQVVKIKYRHSGLLVGPVISAGRGGHGRDGSRRCPPAGIRHRRAYCVPSAEY